MFIQWMPALGQEYLCSIYWWKGVVHSMPLALRAAPRFDMRERMRVREGVCTCVCRKRYFVESPKPMEVKRDLRIQ